MKANAINLKKFIAPGIAFTLAFLILIPMLCPATAYAAAPKNEWKVKGGYVYYYNAKGEKISGKKLTIDGNDYEFGQSGKLVTPGKRVKAKSGYIYETGVDGKLKTGLISYGETSKLRYYDKNSYAEKFGWQKSGSKYYFFKLNSGIAVTGKTVNSIRLGSDGKAKIPAKNKFKQQKIKMLIQAQKIIEQKTKPTMTRGEKLRICFDWTEKISYKDKYAKSAGDGGFTRAKKDPAFAGHWEVAYAKPALFQIKGNGKNCFIQASSFAFLANAIGYKDVVVVTSGGHCWSKVAGKSYDQYRNWYARPYSKKDDRYIAWTAKI
jgi:hypothetical protein